MMKPAALAWVVLCSAVSLGCGSHSSAQTSVPSGFPNGVQPVALSPEATITKIETPEDRAIYLRQLKNDSNFEPQKHLEMLKKCANDSNQEVAEAAKELLERQ
jgi:hypothetical protein